MKGKPDSNETDAPVPVLEIETPDIADTTQTSGEQAGAIPLSDNARCEFSTRAIGELVTLQTEKVFEHKNPELPYIGIEHIASGQPKLMGTARAQESTSVNSVFRTDDILFAKLRPNLRKSVRALFDGYCSTDILVLRCLPGMLPDYAEHLFQTDAVFRAAAASAAGTRMPRTSWSDIKRISVLVPGKDADQRRIAGFLSVVDQAIEERETIAKKLKQLRTGLLHELLTRGIDESGELRDPVRTPKKFVDTPLGPLPREWRVESFSGFLHNSEYGISSSLSDKGATPVLRMNNFCDGEADVSDLRYTSLSVPKSLMLRPGDVLFNRTNSLEHVGRTGIWRGQIDTATFASYLVRLNPKQLQLRNEFLNLGLGLPLVQKRMRQFATTAVQQVNINPTSLGQMLFAAPVSLSEQDAIIDRARQFDDALREEKATRLKLRNLRAGLSNDLLTGRVRVPPALELP